MLRPSGAMLSSVTSPPSRRNSSGATAAAAPLAQSATMRNPAERKPRHAVDEKLNVVGLKGSIVLDGGQGSGIGRGNVLRGVMEDLVFHRQLHRVGQLESVAAEELDAVVLPGIVRGRDDHAGMKAMGARQKGHGRCGHNARALDPRSRLTQSGGQHGSDPRAGLARVAAQDHLGLRGFERVAEGQAAGKNRGCIEGFFPCDGADAVGTEELACVGRGHRLTFSVL